MGKKRTNLSLLKDEQQQNVNNFEYNYNGDDKLRRKRSKNIYSSINFCACLIWILIAIICVLINKLYFFNDILKKDKSSSLIYSNNFILNYEHVTFPQIENGENKQKSQISSVNRNNDGENDFDMVVFHEEEAGERGEVNNETKTGK
jgi:hypothetical protein